MKGKAGNTCITRITSLVSQIYYLHPYSKVMTLRAMKFREASKEIIWPILLQANGLQLITWIAYFKAARNFRNLLESGLLLPGPNMSTICF